MIEAYFLHLMIIACIYIILTISLNLSMGFTGLLNIGHAAFYGIGAYASALLALNFGLPFWIGLLVGGLVAAFFGFLLAFPTLRLRGDYLALATLGFGFVVEAVLKNWVDLTRGPLGLPGIPKPELFGFAFDSLLSYFLLSLVFVVITYFVVSRIVHSPFGRVLKAVRDDEVAAASIGKNVFQFKALALIVSAFFAGIAGSLYAHYITFIDPTSFTVMESMLVISMVVVGGMASVRGSVLGAIVLVLLPEPLRFLNLPSSMVGALRQLIYAFLLIILVLKRPQGILGEKVFGRKKNVTAT
ncbi:MAG: branched-chain amino acid ABC transporter permease [archaeon]